MKVIDTKIVSLGLHANPSKLLCDEAARFRSKITITTPGGNADLKKLIDVVSLGIIKGSHIKITIDGLDEEVAHSSLLYVLTNNKMI